MIRRGGVYKYVGSRALYGMHEVTSNRMVATALSPGEKIIVCDTGKLASGDHYVSIYLADGTKVDLDISRYQDLDRIFIPQL